jgi:citronellol/citronellal dehydrogenase
MAKMGMSFVTLGLAAEFGPQGVAVNALWPRTVIATDAINMIPGVSPGQCRTPEIVADAAHAILVRPSDDFHGHFLIDDDVLFAAGITDFSGYAVDPSQRLLPDLFLG